MADPSSWTFGAVGDVFIHRPDPHHAFSHSEELLKSVDILFGNCEGTYTDCPSPSPGGGWVVSSPQSCATALGPAGFHVMSCANNHTLDGGYDGLNDTLAVLERQSIKTVGAGVNSGQARKPAVVERNGIKTGFLAFSCVHPPGYAARAKMPGIAAIRVHSQYYVKDGDPYEYIEPGHRPHVMTFPWTEDVEMLGEAIAALRSSVDVVVTSFHWGTAREPAKIMDYERLLGRAAIDAGSDIVLGHHHHFLRGIEYYKDRPIFYGLGHFVFDLKTAWTDKEIAYLRSLGEFGIYPREGYPLLPFHPDARLTMMVVFNFSGARLAEFGLVPCVISPENHAVPASADSAEGLQVLAYLHEVSRQAEIFTQYSPDGPLIGQFRSIKAAAQVR